MALYQYQGYAKDGKRITGTIDAPTTEAVRQQLVRQNIYPITISLAAQGTRAVAWYKKIFARAVSLKEKILFTKQLAVLLRSGVPLLQAMELLIDQFESTLRSMLIAIKDGIKEGRSLADGLAQYPQTFDTIYIQLVRAGEATGKLEVILDRLVVYMERRAEIIKRVKGALSYPLIQLSVVVLVVIALLMFVIPKLADTFTAQGAQLPLPTRILMALSEFLLNHYIALLIGLGLLVALYMWWSKTARGARMIDQIKLRLPIVRFFSQMGAVVQFSRTLGMLIESGVNLAEALDIVVKIIDNRILKDALSQARDKIIKQGKIAEYLQQTGIFPPIAIYLLRTGEESGQLDQMLLTVAQNYESDLADFSDSLASKIEPIMLIVMGVVVGFVVLSVILPMVNMTNLQ